MWTGNYDGAREGLVVASTKEKAWKAVRAGRTDFNAYWREQPLDPSFEHEVLYTRKIDHTGVKPPWTKGLCALPVRSR